jgi:hypothetical protein
MAAGIYNLIVFALLVNSMHFLFLYGLAAKFAIFSMAQPIYSSGLLNNYVQQALISSRQILPCVGRVRIWTKTSLCTVFQTRVFRYVITVGATLFFYHSQPESAKEKKTACCSKAHALECDTFYPWVLKSRSYN